MYDEIFVVEKTSVGDSVISFVCNGWIDIMVSLWVALIVEVPLLISFIVGVWLVKMKPGFIERIWVWFVVSWIVKFCWIVFDLSSFVSLYRMFSILIVKFPGRVV